MAKHGLFDRWSIGTSVKLTALLVGVTAIGITAWRVVKHIDPLLEASAGYAMKGQMVNGQDIAGALDGPFTIGIGVIASPLAKMLVFPAYGYFNAYYSASEATTDGLTPRF